ncbi:amidohydrolase family protein [Clostridiaceae bacterium 35-E11]
MDFDILLRNCTVISMDKDRRILREATIGIKGDTIAYVGKDRDEFQGLKVIDGKGKVVLPGFIDSHAHAGHGLLKTLGEGIIEDGLLDLYEYIYYQCTTPEFWFAEAQLSGIEKIRFGVTTGVSYLGSDPRYDDLVYAQAHVEGMKEVGIRDILGIGTPYPPFPKTFRDWDGFKIRDQKIKSFEDSFTATYNAVKKFNNTNDGLTFCYPTPSAIGNLKELTIDQLKAQSKAMRDVAEEFGTPIHSHSFGGDIKFAYEHLDILGPKVFTAHVTGISEEEIKIIADTGTNVCSGPYTTAYIHARCPVVELLEAGANVTFCTDASAPNRTYDLLEKIRIGMLLHRSYFHNPSLITAGKALEMVTIDAAKAIGLDTIIGSIEVGKKADVICVNMQKPHLYPVWQEPVRMVYQASGHDVDTVIVSGKVLMEDNQIAYIDESKVLENAQKEAMTMLKRAEAEKYIQMPKHFWGAVAYKEYLK